ncbi:MAG: hypothetical protein IKC01_09735 [Clostridia bacterium]|nr:hypothetical protein [Clostridia bacterium]
MFAYCENDPVNYSDGFGNFSVKKANEVLVKILSNIKGAFFDYIFSLLKNEKGEPAIHTDIIAVVINTIIRVFLTKALVTAANSVLTVASKTYLKTHTGDAINKYN